ncbi:hypothetical protein DIE09_28220 [Burkholderia sp. Bp9010]|nr:hypothetical protein DIE09_28220 [Burkholderia sp. Bp9010]
MRFDQTSSTAPDPKTRELGLWRTGIGLPCHRKREIGAAIQFCLAADTQVERGYDHIGQRVDQLNVTAFAT